MGSDRTNSLKLVGVLGSKPCENYLFEDYPLKESRGSEIKMLAFCKGKYNTDEGEDKKSISP